MESKKINQLATELAPDLTDLTIIGDPTTGISKKITLSQMASLFTGTVEEYANFAAFPLVGVADTIYIALNTNIIYRWNTGTSAYVELSPNIVTSLVFNDANGFDGTISLVGSTATLTITTALTTGSVGFIGASGALLQDNANFFWDDTNNRLGLGTNAPTTAIDVFGSGIIGRLNGNSTNNAFLGFASAGSNKWSVGNVQSDHRFRIFSEANSAELISVLQTGEFGIGIANPTTKFHIDGAASALIANLDANVSVAKTLSFRSDNSNRINLEVSGTESGSNAGANFFIRRYSDAGALIDTPLTITRSTGIITAATTDFNISSTTPILRLTDSAATGNGGNVYLRAEKTGTGYNNLNYIGFQHIFKGGGSETTFLTIDSSGISTFINSITATQLTLQSFASGRNLRLSSNPTGIEFFNSAGAVRNWQISAQSINDQSLDFTPSTANGGTTYSTPILSLQGVTSRATILGDLLVKKSGAPQAIFSVDGTTGLFFRDGTNAAWKSWQIATSYNDGSDLSFMPSTNTTGAPTWGSTVMVLQGNGRVGINAISPTAALEVMADSSVVNAFRITSTRAHNLNTDVAMVFRYLSDSTNYAAGGLIVVAKDNTTSGNSDGNMQFFTNRGGPTEVMRLTSQGMLDIKGNNNNVSGMNALTVRLGSNCNNTSSYGYVLETGGSNKCFIYGNGNIVNTNNSYGPISDIKLKENIVDTTPKLNDLMKIRIVNYNLKASLGYNSNKQIGVIAQELEQIFPGLVDETEDFKEVKITDEEGNINTEKQYLGTTTKSVKMSVFVPMLIKAMQEQQAQIEELKALINK